MRATEIEAGLKEQPNSYPLERRPVVLIDEILAIKRFLDTLPGAIPNVVPGDDECVEMEMHGVHLFASVCWVESMGSLYTVSFALNWGGSFADIVLVRELLFAVFGEPTATHNKGTKWWYFFPTPDERIPPSLAQLILGTKRLKQLVAELTSDEQEVLYRVLATLGSFPGDFDIRIRLTAPLLARVARERRLVFQRVFTSILVESGQTRAKVPMSTLEL